MAKKNQGIHQRIRAGEIRKQDVTRRLAELAFGRVNDCVKLALVEEAELDGLDLSLLSEVRRTEKGLVEIKLIDRLKVLEQLGKALEADGNQMAALLEAVGSGEAR